MELGRNLELGYQGSELRKSSPVQGLSPAWGRDKPWDCRLRVGWRELGGGPARGSVRPLAVLKLALSASCWSQAPGIQKPVKALGSPSPAGGERGARGVNQLRRKIESKKAEFRAGV